MSRSAWRSPPRRVHSALEVLPALLGKRDIRLRNRRCVLAQHVEQDDQVAGAPVENPIELGAVVATQLAQLAAYLARVREWWRGCGGRLIVQTIDLEVDRRLLALVERVKEVPDRLGPIRGAVVNGLRARHAAVLPIAFGRASPERRADSRCTISARTHIWPKLDDPMLV